MHSRIEGIIALFDALDAARDAAEEIHEANVARALEHLSLVYMAGMLDDEILDPLCDVAQRVRVAIRQHATAGALHLVVANDEEPDPQTTEGL